eukprot:TRINITY_DN7397_c0_g1_i1.p1 TRINITY_DN7397_c0_g1~~TRINITY_DN7397_c0_g1_i1.p1  ORF type:complete len:404 (+),score=165.27 TRINITY_DN7397_c0_g1_i1:55-1212(+)
MGNFPCMGGADNADVATQLDKYIRAVQASGAKQPNASDAGCWAAFSMLDTSQLPTDKKLAAFVAGVMAHPRVQEHSIQAGVAPAAVAEVFGERADEHWPAVGEVMGSKLELVTADVWFTHRLRLCNTALAAAVLRLRDEGMLIPLSADDVDGWTDAQTLFPEGTVQPGSAVAGFVSAVLNKPSPGPHTVPAGVDDACLSRVFESYGEVTGGLLRLLTAAELEHAAARRAELRAVADSMAADTEAAASRQAFEKLQQWPQEKAKEDVAKEDVAMPVAGGGDVAEPEQEHKCAEAVEGDSVAVEAAADSPERPTPPEEAGSDALEQSTPAPEEAGTDEPERRIDPTETSGETYTREEFVQFYGRKLGSQRWREGGRRMSRDAALDLA